MKIGIDARCLEWQRGGVARILSNMFRLWPQITDCHHFILYFEKYIPKDDFLTHPYFECKIIKGHKLFKIKRIFIEQLLMPAQIRRDALDLFFAPWYYAPLYCPVPKTVVAAWDISYTTHRSHYKFREGLQLSVFSRLSCKRAEGVITCSPFDGKQIEKYYGIPSEKICVLHLAPDDKFNQQKNDQKIEEIRKKYKLPKRYILSLGVIFNRRNVDVIIDAFRDIYKKYPDIGLLVIGQNKTSPLVDIESRMKPLIEEGRGQYLSWLPEDELVEIYSGAWYYICTSTVDGESIMLKEAMKCGTPVITSPLLEASVGGSAIILENPNNKDETAELFDKIIQSKELREKYANAGHKWVEKLSWLKVAEDSLKFIECR